MSTPEELKLKLAALQSNLEDYLSENATEKLTDEERQIIEQFRTLPKETQAAFKNLLDNVAKLSVQNSPKNYWAWDDDDSSTDNLPKNYLAADDDDSPTDGLPKIGTPLNDCSWEQISAVSKAGLGATYFNIGDCKEITLNGKIGDCLTLDNEKLSVFILHFNYPINGKPSNNIIWGGFKTADGTDVALCDINSRFGTASTDGTICLNMNHSGQTKKSKGNGYYGTNYGGWKGCDFRYDILGATSTQPSEYNQRKSTANVGYDATTETLTNPKANTLLAALPADFRNALRLWSRWIDTKGNCSNVDANIEETIDAVTLLTEVEIHGKRIWANEYEQNHQTQMDYYRLGNGKIKNNHADTSSATWWWLASPNYSNNSNFSNDHIEGVNTWFAASSSHGVAPAFMT